MVQIYCTPSSLFALARSCFYAHNCGFVLPDETDSCPVSVVNVRAELVDGEVLFSSFPRYQVIYSVPHAPNVEARITLDLQYMDYWFLMVSAWADNVQLVDMFFTVSHSQIERFNIFLMDEPEKGGKVKKHGN